MANRNKNVMRKDDPKRKFKDNKQWKPKYKGTDKEEVSDISPKSGPNDLNWYVISDQVLNDAARVPYSIPVGMPFTRNGKITPSSGVDLASYDDAIPGILVSYVVPLLGNAQQPSDAVNVAANSVYQFVRSRISGSRPYDAVDMMIYLGAMDSIYCYVTYLTRLYATVFTYHQANRYLSRALIEAQNVDYDDLVANLSAFRAAINVKIAKIRSLYLPSILPIFKRHSWLFSHYYIEGESEKDQIYFHCPAGVHRFTYDSDNAGMLECYSIMDQGTPITTAGLLNLLDNLINPVYQDEDFNRISGDFLKAYEGNVFTVDAIPDIVTISLLHSEEVLLQFKNAKYKYVRQINDRFPFFNYTQDSNKLYLKMDGTDTYLDTICEIDNTHNHFTHVDSSASTQNKNLLNLEKYDWSKDTLLTSPRSDVTPGETMINTRLTLAFEVVDDASSIGGAKFYESYCGSEWPVEYQLFTYHRSKSTGNITLFSRRYDSHISIHMEYIDFTRAKSWVLSQNPVRTAFKYLPELTIIFSAHKSDGSYETVDPGRSLFEVDNYALVNANVILGLHNAAILGEYNIPNLAISK